MDELINTVKQAQERRGAGVNQCSKDSFPRLPRQVTKTLARM